jgi:hypothetical protein
MMRVLEMLSALLAEPVLASAFSLDQVVANQ